MKAARSAASKVVSCEDRLDKRELTALNPLFRRVAAVLSGSNNGLPAGIPLVRRIHVSISGGMLDTREIRVLLSFPMVISALVEQETDKRTMAVTRMLVMNMETGLALCMNAPD
jgi:hypothetical protein